MKTISIILAVMLNGCLTKVHNGDVYKRPDPDAFQFCNQTLSKKFIEGNCTKLYNTAQQDSRFCTECPNTSFRLNKDSLIYSIRLDSLSKHQFEDYMNKFASEYGKPSVTQHFDGESYGWSFLKDDLDIMLIKSKNEMKSRDFHYQLGLHKFGLFKLP
ncbi:MAG: hypothetical protein ACKVOR_06075 [Flavobacteriales bacterium]